MTRTPLTEIAHQLGLRSETSIWGRWLRFPTDRGTVYVVQAAFGHGYYMWCEAPGRRTARLYRDPRDAIEAGLMCGTRPTTPLAQVTTIRRSTPLNRFPSASASKTGEPVAATTGSPASDRRGSGD